ncbi:MAG: 3-deoxy-8-phosphooctulonate synthase [Bacteroidales bacterium]
MYSIPNLKHTDSENYLLIAGPCVIENEDTPYKIAEHICQVSDELKIPFVFKASYKKANRSKVSSFTGIGDKKGLEVLANIRKQFQIPVVTDIHHPEEAMMAAQYVDILQIPAFLCRQTELLIAAAETDKIVNIKKGQFLSPNAMQHAAQKVFDSGNSKVMLTERGTTFGYHDLIVDMRSIPIMQEIQLPVILDITHSLQKPNQTTGVTGGQPEMIETIARAGIAVGADGIFVETHPEPQNAKSDGANMLKMNDLKSLLVNLARIKAVVNKLK